MQNLDFSSADLDEAEDFLVTTYARMQITGDRQTPRTRIRRRWFGAVNYDELDFDYELGFDVAPLERVCVCRVRSGYVAENLADQRSDVFRPGEVNLLAPPHLPYSGRLRATYDVVMFDTDQLSRVAATASSRPDEVIRLHGHRPVSPAAGRQLNAAIDYVRDLIETVPDAPPLLVATATQHLAASVLTALPNDVSGSGASTNDSDGTPTSLRRAIAFIDANAHTDIALSDIAAAAYLTPRSVQHLFRRHRDCTPMEYVRRFRLQNAHDDLLAGDPETTSVSAIARKWGFGHLGRFAIQYRQEYGDSPSVALAR